MYRPQLDVETHERAGGGVGATHGRRRDDEAPERPEDDRVGRRQRPADAATATLATPAALVSTGAVFVRSKMTQTAVAVAANPKMAEGLAYSFAALCGNTAASLLRKQVSRSSKVKPAEQVGLATALQGIVACAYCAQQGLFSTAVTSAFLIPAVGSAVLNALTKTLETKAYAITDVSLCAPFLAFDPVMQFLLPVLTQA